MKMVNRNPVLRETAHLLVPLILMYALYVQFHGELGPGGGFQGGVIFATGILVYALIHGRERLRRVISPRAAEVLACLGVLLYGGTGMATMLLGGEFLNYSVFADNPIVGQHVGIWLVELGIGITIVGVVVVVFHLFADARKPRE